MKSCIDSINHEKPMRGHTLMQTIARANRVYGDKVNGLIMGYANVFQELEKALAIYGSGTGGGWVVDLPQTQRSQRIAKLAALDSSLRPLATFAAVNSLMGKRMNESRNQFAFQTSRSGCAFW